MKVILIKFHSPQDVGVEFEPLEVQKDACFRILRYTSEPSALWAYANTPCTWSTLKDENDDLQAFIDEAWEHIQNEDYEWLEQNFV